MPMIGRLFHFGFDALAVSAVLAGIKKTTGFAPDTSQIPESSIKSIADGYFSAGESVFNFITGQAVTSQYFKRVN